MMKRHLTYTSVIFWLILCFTLFLVRQNHLKTEMQSESEEAAGAMDEDLVARGEWMQEMLSDPLTGKIPEGIHQLELSYSASLPVVPDVFSKSDYGMWIQRGPGNLGGRTRAVGIDKTNENILLAGATAGGIWRSEDAGTTWQRMSADTDYIPASCIVQDPRSGKTNNWYVGTGEVEGSALPGGYIYGYGMRKSTDGGKSWKRLYNTFSPNPQYDWDFDFITRMAVNPAIDSLDVVFAATYNGIFRSVDGGLTWSRRRGASGSTSAWTDVAITKNGVVYVALSAGGHAGVWRSTNNGSTWTNISPGFFNTNVGRIVMCLAPSDNNQIYFTAFSPGSGKQTVNFNGDVEWNSIWKYTYLSGDGTGSGGNWEDRSANIPTGFPGDFGQFISQQGYSLHIDVNPENPDLVFLGGTCLYRSTDGFKTNSNSVQIGGYNVGTVRPDYKVYPNHHPDQHGVIFYPSHPKRAISMDDGGIQRTEDCSATTVNWNPLNAAYITSQFYTVALDHTTSSPIIIGGLQDNGSQLTASMDYTKPWVMPYNSDGSHCFVGAGATEYYVSIQQGRVSRILLDADYKLTQMARIDPKGLEKNKYQFINPFAVDKQEWKRVYIPNGNTLWRNNDVSLIPLHNQIDSNAVLTGWEEVTVARLPDSNDRITAISTSSAQPDVLFYGTSKGRLYKLSNASTTNASVQIITGSNFPSGYINNITVHPTDTNKLYCVYSNYAILSVFYSSDAGATWTAISGNLEQNANGSGNGPSCRWLTVVPLSDSTLYFLGTSTGLYSTSKLNGTNTVWSRQGPHSIGFNMVTMMDFRTTDNTLAVATYGAGVFSSVVSSKDRTGIKEFSTLNHVQVYPNPAHDVIHLSAPASIIAMQYEMYDLNGKLVMKNSCKREDEVDVSYLRKGIYFMKISSGKEMVTKKIVLE